MTPKTDSEEKNEDVEILTGKNKIARNPQVAPYPTHTHTTPGVEIPTLRCKLCRVVGFVGGVDRKTKLNLIGLPVNPHDLSPWLCRLKHIGACPGQNPQNWQEDIDLLSPQISWGEAKYLHRVIQGGGKKKSKSNSTSISNSSNVMATYVHNQGRSLQPGMVVVGSTNPSGGGNSIFGTISKTAPNNPNNSNNEGGLLIDHIPNLATGVIVPRFIGVSGRDGGGERF